MSDPFAVPPVDPNEQYTPPPLPPAPPMPSSVPIDPVIGGVVPPAPAVPDARPQPRYGAYAEPGQVPTAPPIAPTGPPAYSQFAGQGLPAASPYGDSTPYGGVINQLKVGDALRFAWEKYKANWGTWVIFMLLGVVVMGLLAWPLVNPYRDWIDRLSALPSNAALADIPLPQFPGTAIAAMIVMFLVMIGFTVCGWNAALKEADGTKPGLAKFFAHQRLWIAFGTYLVISVASLPLSFMLIGSLVWSLFTLFAIPCALEHLGSVFGSIGESFKVVSKQLGAVILLALATIGINILGALALGVGLFVTIPLTVLAFAYAFRRITGGTIA